MAKGTRRESARRDPDSRAWRYLDNANMALELTYLRAGSDPDWERVVRDGVDITDQPGLWNAYQRARRQRFEARLAQYKADGLL